MDESILNSIKALLGPDSDYNVFDPDIIIFINGAFSTLTQLGIGPKEGFKITGADETWEDFIGDVLDLESVKTFVYLKVRILFDPPSSSFVLSAMQRECDELAWRLNVEVDPRVN